MPDSNNQTVVILAVAIILVTIGIFILVMLSYYNNRKRRLKGEQELLKREFEQRLLKSQLDVQERTMQSISHEIHDDILGRLNLAKLNVLTCENDVEKRTAAYTMIESSIEDLRWLSKNLSAARIVNNGLIESIRELLRYLETTKKLKTEFILEDDMTDDDVKVIEIFRIVQEVLTNIMKHSEATSVELKMDKHCLSIKDNGKGFVLDNGIGKGVGLVSMQKRAALINATISIDSSTGKGTIFRLTL